MLPMLSHLWLRRKCFGFWRCWLYDDHGSRSRVSYHFECSLYKIRKKFCILFFRRFYMATFSTKLFSVAWRWNNVQAVSIIALIWWKLTGMLVANKLFISSEVAPNNLVPTNVSILTTTVSNLVSVLNHAQPILKTKKGLLVPHVIVDLKFIRNLLRKVS